MVSPLDPEAVRVAVGATAQLMSESAEVRGPRRLRSLSKEWLLSVDGRPVVGWAAPQTTDGIPASTAPVAWAATNAKNSLWLGLTRTDW